MYTISLEHNETNADTYTHTHTHTRTYTHTHTQAHTHTRSYLQAVADSVAGGVDSDAALLDDLSLGDLDF
jgi:hypothetical protein